MSELSYLEKLLDGVEVEWVTLGSMADIGTGSSNRQDESENGIYPFYVRSKNILKSDTFEFDEVAIVIPGEGGIGDIFHYVEGKYALHQRAYRIRITTNAVDTKFLYYFMSSSFKQYILTKSVGATAISIRKPMLEGFKVPIPSPDNPEKSLAIQSEIVRILDTFTALTAELTAELTARKKQYNYYRDRLLSFDEGEVEWKALGEVGHIVTGRTPKSSDKSAWGDDVDFVTPSDIKNGMRNITCPSRRLSAEGAASMPKVRIPRGSLLVTCIGADMGKTVINANDCIPNQQINAITLSDDSVQVGYLFHILTAMRETLRRQGELGGGTMPLINKSDFSKIVVPIPSHEEQNRIAKILDKFDTLTNSITEGLPREIELRQKQYEYYRDLLFSFPKPETVSN
ncbi:restriction endonuclease subunit S [Salmonella enterica subsp. enterica serovar Indiana]|nr:restriction endonuclease subunit S [Salmonella enterica subsp. enterica serovar Indiana]